MTGGYCMPACFPLIKAHCMCPLTCPYLWNWISGQFFYIGEQRTTQQHRKPGSMKESKSVSRAVMSNSLQLQGPARLLSMGFSRQEYWSGWPFPSPGDLPNPGLLHCRQNLCYLIHSPQWIDSYPVRTKYDQKFSGTQKWRASWWTHRKNDAKGNKIQGSEKCLLKSIAKSLNFRKVCIQQNYQVSIKKSYQRIIKSYEKCYKIKSNLWIKR